MSIKNKIGEMLIGSKNLSKLIDKRIRYQGYIHELTNDDDDITKVGPAKPVNYTGNDYTNYETAVTAIDKKYNGRDDWGCPYTGSIIDVRSAFTIPAGLKIVVNKDVKGEPKNEMAFAKEFFRYNELDKHIPIEMAKESEIEGKICVTSLEDKKYEWDMGKIKITGMVKERFLTWSSNKYKIKTPTDYMDYESLVYKDENEKEQTIKQPDFTYRRFGGRIDKPNFPAMKIWKCLTYIDRLDKAMADWRRIDELFSSPTPTFKCETKEQVEEILSQLAHVNWRIGKLLATTADFSLVGPDTSGIDKLEKEILTCVKVISGNTGVPVHFLGLPELMSNRATADNLMELVWASTMKEREIWESAWTEILEKAIDKFNKMQVGTGVPVLRNNVLRVEIVEVSASVWQRLEKLYMPMLMAGKLSLEWVLSQIPNLDVKEELDRQKKAEEEKIKENQDQLNQMIDQNQNQNQPPGQPVNQEQNQGGQNNDQNNNTGPSGNQR